MLLIGVASVANQSDFKAPSNFEDIGDGVFVLYDHLKMLRKFYQ